MPCRGDDVGITCRAPAGAARRTRDPQMAPGDDEQDPRHGLEFVNTKNIYISIFMGGGGRGGSGGGSGRVGAGRDKPVTNCTVEGGDDCISHLTCTLYPPLLPPGFF